MDNKIIYRIDAQDRIVFVNDEWERFALSNNGVALKSENILNRSIWNFITDETTRQLYKEIFRQARLKRFLNFNFRCDSPECVRFLEMNISSEAAEVQIEIETIKIESRNPPALFDENADRSESFITMCSWCKKIEVSEKNWKEVAEGLQSLELFEQDAIPQITHGICNDCFVRISETLNGN